MAESKAHIKYQGHGLSRIEADLARHKQHCSQHTNNRTKTPMIKRALSAGQRPSICIVGAGVSGLRAAEVLHKRGAQVTIYEARERIGGRLCQASVAGHQVDLGPNWIHGTENNPILDLAHATGTLLHSWGEREASYDSDGQRLSDSDVAEISETFWGIISDAFHISNEKHGEIPPERSLWDFVKEQAGSKFTDETAQDAQRKRELLLKTAYEWGNFVGSTIKRQSLKFFWLEECIEGVNPFVAGTYKKVLAKIAAPALKDVPIHFGRAVDRISSSEGRVTVQCKDDSAAAFDEVLVTIPLGCMQQAHITFDPPLPARMLKAIDAIGYGCLDKVYVSFPHAFWEQRPHSKHHSQTLDPPAASDYPGFSHFLEPQYATTTNPNCWSQEMLSLSALPSESAHPTLLFYIFGDNSVHIADLVAKTPSDKIQQALFAFFEPYYSRLPGWDPDSPYCRPVEALATAWVNDPLAGNGSYSCFRTGLEQGDQDIECMREGVPSQNVWFAGEHTAPFVALGTVTGAYWSGDGVAKRIADAYDMN